jgi:hypothetical protein
MITTLEAELIKSITVQEQMKQAQNKNLEMLKNIRRRQKLYGIPMSLAMKHQKQISGNTNYKDWMKKTHKVMSKLGPKSMTMIGSPSKRYPYTGTNFWVFNSELIEFRPEDI